MPEKSRGRVAAVLLAAADVHFMLIPGVRRRHLLTHSLPRIFVIPAGLVVEGYTPEQVEEVRMVVRLLPIFFTTILYWTVYAQMGTFFIMQARPLLSPLPWLTCRCSAFPARRPCSSCVHGSTGPGQTAVAAGTVPGRVSPAVLPPLTACCARTPQGTQMERSMFGGSFYIPAASLSRESCNTGCMTFV